MNATREGKIILYTGSGKGKTTAALGLLFRSWGHEFQVCMIQFMKSDSVKSGEVQAARQIGIEWFTTGEGFTWSSSDLEPSIHEARQGWQLSKEKNSSGAYDLIVLDEFTYPLTAGWLEVNDIILWLTDHKPSGMHLVLTGRNAPPEMVEYADLATVMRNIKHPFDRGATAQKGIEF